MIASTVTDKSYVNKLLSSVYKNMLEVKGTAVTQMPNNELLIKDSSGFGGLEVACWPLVPKVTGSNPAEAVGFFGRKNPQHVFLRRGSKAICPMSCFTACKRTQK
jgi:hypothetical protein